MVIRLCTGKVGTKCKEHGQKIRREPDPFTFALAEEGEKIPDAIGCDKALRERALDV